MIFGSDWEKQIEEGRLESFEEFSSKYLEIKEKINSNDELIESYNEKIKYYENLKEKWTDIADAYKESVDRRILKMWDGEDAEKKVLEGSLDQLEKYKKQYLKNQQDIIDASWDAANEKVKAAKAGDSGAGGSSSVNLTEKYDNEKKIIGVITQVDKNGTEIKGSRQTYVYEGEDGKKIEDEINKATPDTYKRWKFKKFARGGHNLAEQIAWTQENGQELVLSPTRNAILTKLESGDSVLTASATKNMFEWAKLDPHKFLPDLTAIGRAAASSSITQNIAVTLPNITNQGGYENLTRYLNNLSMDAMKYVTN